MSNMQKVEPIPVSDSDKTVGLMLLAAAAGLLAGLYFMPQLLPGLTTSIFGPNPKVYWYLSRGSAFVSFWLLWLSMALGLALTGRVAKIWPGALQALDLHEFVSLLGLGTALFHALILTGDRFIQFTITQVLIPFAGQSYAPIWVGIGQVAFYAWGLITLSFYFRKWLGTQTWRMIHLVSFVVYALALVHGIASGTDSGAIWAVLMYWASAGSLLFLLFYRILNRLMDSRLKRSKK